jgi:hypothetical protein
MEKRMSTRASLYTNGKVGLVLCSVILSADSESIFTFHVDSTTGIFSGVFKISFHNTVFNIKECKTTIFKWNPINRLVSKSAIFSFLHKELEALLLCMFETKGTLQLSLFIDYLTFFNFKGILIMEEL